MSSIKQLKENSIILPLVKASAPLIWAYTREETRMFIEEKRALLASKIVHQIYLHDALNTLEEHPQGRKAVNVQTLNALKAVSWFVRSRDDQQEGTAGSGSTPRQTEPGQGDLMEDYAPDQSVLFLFDAAAGLQTAHGGKHSNPQLTRLLKKSWRQLVTSRKSIVIVSHTPDIPPELEHSMVFAEHQLPTVQQLSTLVESGCSFWQSSPQDVAGRLQMTADETRRLAGNLSGLTWAEGDNVLARAANVNMERVRLSPEMKKEYDEITIREERIRNISKNPTLEIITPKGDLSLIGGLKALKAYFRQRRKVFEPAWRDEGLSAPKGVLLGGLSGTGTYLLICHSYQQWCDVQSQKKSGKPRG